MRGKLFVLVLVLAAAITVGLWYLLAPSDTRVVTQPETAGPLRDPTPATGDSQTVDSGTASAADGPQTADSGPTMPASDPQAPDSGAALPTDVAQTTDSDAVATAGIAQTTETGTVPAANAAQATDSSAAEAALQIAAVEKADQSITQELVLAPAPEGTIERTPIDAPAEGESDQKDIVSVVARELERIKTAIRERLDADTKLHVQIEYDDSPEDAAQVGVKRNETDQTAGTAAAPPAQVAQTTDTDATEAEAKLYVQTLTETTPQAIPVDKADHFVTQDHVLSLVPEDTIESVSVGALANDEALKADTPITVVREVEQIETAVPEQLIAEAGGDLDTQLRVLLKYDDSQGVVEQEDAEQNVAEQITVREILERILTEPKKPISIVKTVRYFEVMTLRELLDSEEDADTFLNVVTRPYRIEAATLAELLQRQKTENPDTIFYLHTVQPTDEQGIWGIVHFGLIENFARGMAVKRGERLETYTVRIPRDADERLHDQSSSFLGKLLDRKTEESFVYNFRNSRMGRNPDRIYPGQEIVIIHFEPEELISIYKHFATG